MKSPIIPIEPKSIGPEEELWKFWKDLSVENEFCDVTLVCENKQISDHKLVF